MARSLNRVQLIGNLTRDPELRYTPQGTAVCSFSIATNRSWTTDAGEKKDEADFHRIVAWNKLAELCSQFLTKGKKVYVEGRLSTRNWQGQDGAQRSTTEVIISDMILLDGGGARVSADSAAKDEEDSFEESTEDTQAPAKKETKSKKESKKKEEESEVQESASETSSDEVAPDDIPF